MELDAIIKIVAEKQVQNTINELRDWSLFDELDEKLQDDIIDEISWTTLTPEDLNRILVELSRR